MCYKCGEKWGPGHRCSSTVSLNVIQDMWQFCSDSASSGHDDSDSGDDLCAISVQAINGIEGIQTIRLRGFINQIEAYMLLDSGSSHSFINEDVASLIPGWQPLLTPVHVKVANGHVIHCTHELPH